MMKKMIILTLFSLSMLVSCAPPSEITIPYQPPKVLDDGIPVGSIDNVNVDRSLLLEAASRIDAGEYGEVHSMLVFKNGTLVFEEYFSGHDYQWDALDHRGNLVAWDETREHNIHSVGKSITAACVGIAIDEGFIGSVNQSIFLYLPNYAHLNTGGKDQITIEHLVTMSSGLEWDEWGRGYTDPENDVIRLWFDCDDPITCILEKPLLHEPGTHFTYSGGNMILLGEIIKNASGMDIEAFAGRYLFEPMEIDQPEWNWINEEVVNAGSDQRMTPREMLKVGVTFLNGGIWNDVRILSEKWIKHSSVAFSGPDNSWLNHPLRPIPIDDGTWGQRGYAYGWWTHEFSRPDEDISAYWASGYGGQSIKILPEQNTVVVFTGANYGEADVTVEILKEYIFPALDH